MAPQSIFNIMKLQTFDVVLILRQKFNAYTQAEWLLSGKFRVRREWDPHKSGTFSQMEYLLKNVAKLLVLLLSTLLLNFRLQVEGLFASSSYNKNKSTLNISPSCDCLAKGLIYFSISMAFALELLHLKLNDLHNSKNYPIFVWFAVCLSFDTRARRIFCLNATQNK